MEKVDGEAYVNIRKGKIIPGYEISVKVLWEGEAKDAQGVTLAKVSGRVELPYIANENVGAGENPDINITVTDNSPVGVRLREAFLSKGKPFILKKVRQYDDLMASGGPAKEELQNKTPPKSTKAAQTVDKNSSLKPAVREEFKRLLIERFNCRASVIYDILMDDNRWKGFSQSNAKISREVGGSFSLFDGAITGVNQTPREVGKNLFSIRSEQCLVMECNGSHVSFPLYTSHLRRCSRRTMYRAVFSTSWTNPHPIPCLDGSPHCLWPSSTA